MNPIIFYGEAAKLAQQAGVPVFTDGNTGKLVKSNRKPCPDCGVHPWTAHEGGCDVARCLQTGRQRLGCRNFGNPAADDCGTDVWTGEWPGEAECREFGWYCYQSTGYATGWLQCEPDHPGAQPDPNRLHKEAAWDAEAKRWRRR